MASKKAAKATAADFDLLDELGVNITPDKKEKYSKLEERVIAGFEEIERFVEEQGHLPRHGENHDIFERRYAIRLDRIWKSEEWRELLKPFDSKGLSTPPEDLANAESLSDVELLAALEQNSKQGSLSELKHVRSAAEVRAAEEIAKRQVCVDFDQFKPLFQDVKVDLEKDIIKTLPWKKDKSVSQGDWFITGGQIAYVAEVGKEFKQAYGDMDARLRVIFDNQTESHLLRRSFQKNLLVDTTSRRLRRPTIGPLFADTIADEDLETGYIYVLQSKSTHPQIAKLKQVIHKIGVTGGKIETRISSAVTDPTYLFADVEVVASYKLANLNRQKLEALIHRFFGDVQLDIELPDRFGKKYKPKEWFVVPLPAINDMITALINGTLASKRYDIAKAKVVNS